MESALMKAIILARGFGTRLRESVRDLPKPMAIVAGRPFLEYVLDRLVIAGINNVTLSVGYKADLIMRHFGNHYRNAQIGYAVEDKPLGTGGAMAFALRGSGKEAVLVLNGDTFLNIDYGQLIDWYMQKPAAVAMVLREMPDTGRYGSVVVSGEHVAGFVEKGRVGSGLINAGVYILKPDVFTSFGLFGKFSFETDVLQAHCRELSPRAFLTSAYFVDIGLPDDYERAQYELPAIV
jgi:D-glycero-alpha-D-manno-heptose 1-phosphate guanylyltransferase